MTKPTNNAPAFALFRVSGDGEEATWTKLGAAWAHKDGKGFSLKLDCIPLDGRIAMRRIDPKTETAEPGAPE